MDAPKQRHGCLTAWLVFMIIAKAFTAVGQPLMLEQIQQAIPTFPGWIVWVMALGAVLNVVFAIALFTSKKWAFFGFLGSSLVAFGLNIYAGIGIPRAVLGLTGVAILYGVLQIGEGTRFDGERRCFSLLDPNPYR
jgi:hypothetical protein